jgi:hypothetical protein
MLLLRRRKENDRMKRISFFCASFLVLFFSATALVQASSRTLVKYVPKNSFIVVGADFAPLRQNEAFLSLEQKGQIWSPEDDSDLNHYMHLLKIDPRRDIGTITYAKYVNSYGNKGRVYVMELLRDLSGQFSSEAGTPYLGNKLYRIQNDGDSYAVILAPQIIAVGTLNEVKTALDVGLSRTPGMEQNPVLRSLIQKIPAQAAVWGAAVPLTRKQAAALGVKQSTNAVLEAFENYYFYGVPKRKTADSFFIGETVGEKEAMFVSTFMKGTVAFAKFKVDEDVADMLDQINIERNGRNIHVSAVVTKAMVDAYLNGELGVGE